MMRKTTILMAALVAGVAMTAAVRGDERATRPAKEAGVSFRAASTTATEGYDKAALDGRTLYIAPQVMLTGDQVTAVSTRQVEGGGAAMSLSLTEQAAGRLSGKGGADHVAVFVDSQLITVGAMSVQGGAATITGLTSGQAERVARLLTRGSASPTAATIKVVPVSQSNGDYVFDVYAQNVSGVRTYQVKLTTAGGDRGSLTLSDVRIDDARPDYLFLGNEAVKAADPSDSRLGGTLFNGAADATAAKYLGTWVFHASADAAGTFQIKVAAGEESFLLDLKSETIPSSAAGATVQIGGVSPKLTR